MRQKKEEKTYVALDMPNGKTYIGEQQRIGGLAKVIVVDTLTHEFRDHDGQYRVQDIASFYRETYRSCRKSEEISSFGSMPIGSTDNVIMWWYIGTDILEEKKPVKKTRKKKKS